MRRVWECPVCHRQEWTGGDVVSRACECVVKAGTAATPTWMRLIEEKPKRREPAPPTGVLPVEPTAISDARDSAESAAAAPAEPPAPQPAAEPASGG